MDYNFKDIEKKWQSQWIGDKVYEVSNDSGKPKYYVLDMFPYPSGAGLHVGHPLGYIASDIFARYKRLKGFNVLHPMGYDAFGLPAEQYAIEHGVHPAVSTEQNINNFRKQLDNIGFSYDWSREVRTSDPAYYKWTQWIFLQLFKSWYNRKTARAEPIEELIKIFEAEGNRAHPIPNPQYQIPQYPNTSFGAEAWKNFPEKTKQSILMEYRIAYCGYGEVNWCEALGTVLANDEVVNGVSERGGYPVVKKKLRQWYLRITEYADRLLKGLDTVDFSDAMKEMQSNWIGKSTGAEIDFAVAGHDAVIRVYTTRPDTIFGVDFMVVAPEHELVAGITTSDRKTEVEEYIAYVKSRSERERMAEKKISGTFTGAFAINPFNAKQIPVWISEYVLAGYGTGAIMAVPSGDERDHKFARHFSLSITNIIGDAYNGEEANPTKDAVLSNSDFLNGMVMRDAIEVVVQQLEARGIGKRKTNYKMRDAAFSRQRYWGEPFPIIWKDGIAIPLDEKDLPLELPFVESYKPGPEGEGPLANIPEWTAKHLETNTMPGYAGSSWYFLRYMDPHNDQSFCDKKVSTYWNQVDLYVGGTEHAVGHLLYSRMWTKCLYDLGLITFDEPFKKLLNQGMIQGSSRFIYRITGTNKYVSSGLIDGYETDKLHVDVNIVDGVELDTEALKKWKPDFADAEFILEEGKYICGTEVEKMSKSKFNTVNPDALVEKYGADTFRMYEMFLGPVEMSKPWDTKGIEGVHRFLKKFWRLFYDEAKGSVVVDAPATPAELKVLHKTIKKIEEDTERFSFNTCVSAFMVCVNDLNDLKCHKRAILETLVILLAPYAPHVSEELWQKLGNKTSVLNASFPKFEAAHVAESTKEYPISINGKMRTTINIDLSAEQNQVEQLVLSNEIVQKWTAGKPPKKIIFVKGKMVNVVV
jgi:leucyl-tRNA synthetase